MARPLAPDALAPVAPGARYERIGGGYARTRREDPRLAARIHAALGDARTVVNVGAGAGSYEPRDRHVVGAPRARARRGRA